MPRRAHRRLLAAALIAALAACSRAPSPAADAHAHTGPLDLFVNGDFEGGNLSSWTVTSNLNHGIVVPPTSVADLQLLAGGVTANTKVITGPSGSVLPQGLSSAASLRVPRYGSNTAVVNELGKTDNVNSISQQMVASNADVDPTDGKVHVRFAVAPVLENPGHLDTQQPYFWVQLKNVTRNSVLFYTFNFSNQPGVPWKSDTGPAGTDTVLYTDWQAFDIAPGPAQLAVGDTVEMLVIAAGCSLGGHWGHLYVDAFGPVLPGLAVTATAPASVNSGATLTYTLTYKNAGPGAGTNTTIVENLPTGTTFASVNAPGATCTTPAVGGTGAVTCNLGTVGATATGSLTVTVNVTAAANTTISNGNYTVASDGASALVGPLVTTAVTSGVSYADLGLTLSDGQAAVGWGQHVSYTLVASNAGPAAASGAIVTDVLPAQLTNATWTCAAAGGAACAAASGTGSIAQTLTTFPSGGTVTFTVSADVVAGSGTGSIVNLASIATPAGVTDNAPGNNAAVDSDAVGTLVALTVQKAGDGTGTVLSSPAALSCATACASQSASFLSGTGVVLTALAAPGQIFRGWSGGCTGTAQTCTTTVSAATTVTATFAAPTHALTFQTDGTAGTSLTGATSQTVADGASATPVTAVPSASTAFVNWTGDAGFTTTSANPLTVAAVIAPQTITAHFAPKLATTVTVAASAAPSVLGQAVTFTATVAPAAGGTVQFTVDGGNLGSPVALAGGAATSPSTSALAVGSHAVGAVYSGDATHLGSSGSRTQVVNQASTTTTLASAPSPSVVGQPVTLTATVAAAAPGGGTPGGTVTFFDGATSLGTGTLDASGVATLTTGTLSAGTHAVTAVYTTSTGYAASTSAAASQVVNQASTTTTLASAPSPSVVGQPVTLTATVAAAAPGGGTPGGTVTFFDGATSLGTGTLDASGVATLTTGTLSAGTHAVTAVYTTSTGYAASTSAAASQVVNQASTTTTLASAPSPSVVGQPVTLTATVAAAAPGGGTPGGTVTFFDGATSLGTGTLDASGVATLTTGTLSAGTHAVTAVYTTSTGYAASTSAAVSQVVDQASTNTTVATGPSPSVVGQPVTLTATVAAAAPGAGTPGGTVTFKDGTTVLGVGTLSGGVATLATSTLGAGPHTITAEYAGSSEFSGSTGSSGGQPQQVQRGGTALALVPSPSPAVYGQAVTIAISATAVAPGAGTPGGEVVVFDGGVEVGRVTLDASGHGTLTLARPLAGDHALTAHYAGDASFAAADGLAGLVVAASTTQVAVTTSQTPSQHGRPVTFTATVTSAQAGGAAPEGQVVFKADGVVIGTGTVVDGVATLTDRSLVHQGSPYVITAEYAGTGNYQAGTGTLGGGQTVLNSAPVAGAGTALALGPGAASQAAIPLPASVGAGSLTLEAWAKADWASAADVPAEPTVASLGGTGGTSLALGFTPDRLHVTWTVAGVERTVPAPVDDRAWHHLAVVSTEAGATLYLDGVQAGSVAGARFPGAGSLVLGAGLLGQVDEVRAWSVARTAAELQAAARSPLASEPAGLIGHWHLDEGSGHQVFDSSPGAHDGTIQLGADVTPAQAATAAFAASQAWRVRQVDQDHAMVPADAGYDPDGDPLTLTIATAAQHGLADRDQQALQVSYRPGGGYLGTDAFTFKLDDGSASDTYELELQVSRILTCRVDADCGGGDLCVQSACAAPAQLDARAGQWGCSTGAGGASALWAFLALGLVRRRPRAGRRLAR